MCIIEKKRYRCKEKGIFYKFMYEIWHVIYLVNEKQNFLFFQCAKEDAINHFGTAKGFY